MLPTIMCPGSSQWPRIQRCGRAVHFCPPDGADAVVDINNHNHHTGIPRIANAGWLPDRYGLVSCCGRVVVLVPPSPAVLHRPTSPGRHLVFSATIGVGAAFSRARAGTPGQ